MTQRPGLGIALILFMAACFATMDTTVKFVGALVPVLDMARATRFLKERPGCRLVGQRCNQRKDCCTNRCAKSQKQCQCLAKGKSCLMTLKGGISFPVHANCCTNRCDNKNRCR